ncbi:HAD family hydrolase [Dermacoccus nishinomiyaensis]|uniref:HAD family hydrolase n=1 Tax=Dermacoccus nishinomiyaensis TaxID=1274 RepID=UPI0028A610B4|nr:HAD family hydrolase [Dermacoccus nishinomiyaensis]
MTSAGLDGPASRATGAGPMPRLVASDLDGTLLDADGRVSERTRAVWSGLGARGIETIVVTARPPRWLDHLAELVGAAGSPESTADDVGAHTLAICANGAFVYDLATRRVIEADGFTADEALAVVEHLRRRFPDAGAAVETERGMFRSAAYPDAHAGMPAHDAGVRDCELTALPPDVVVGKILLRDEAWRGDAFVEALTECLGGRGVLAYSGAAGLAEISAPGVTKAARLEAWCAERGIDANDVWAFGDMPNDIPMLTWAGRGVAVENAHDEVLAIADDTCGPHDADGVARYLERHLTLDCHP